MCICHYFSSHTEYIIYIFCRDAAENDDIIEHTTHSLDGLNYSSNVQNGQTAMQEEPTAVKHSSGTDELGDIWDDVPTTDHDHQYSIVRSKPKPIGPFMCHVCGKIFHLNRKFRKHFRQVHERKRFCITSGDRSKSSNDVGKRQRPAHKEVIATNDAAATADVALVELRDNGDRESTHDHMIKYSGEKPFKCGQCSRVYRSEHSLRRHKIVHTGERKLFLCQYCAQRYLHYNSLLCHILKHHHDKVDSNPDPVQAQRKSALCETCGKTYSSSSALQTHKCSDAVYKCQLCGEQFEQIAALRDHLTVVHCIVLPQYQCSECYESFSAESVLKLHMRVHSDNAFNF